jgi:ATP-dependent protease HslVU (ClpYQ) ATPase subunit
LSNIDEEMADEKELRKSLLEACVQAKRAVNVRQLWEGSLLVLKAKAALVEGQLDDRAIEIKIAETLVGCLTVKMELL